MGSVSQKVWGRIFSKLVFPTPIHRGLPENITSRYCAWLENFADANYEALKPHMMDQFYAIHSNINFEFKEVQPKGQIKATKVVEGQNLPLNSPKSP